MDKLYVIIPAYNESANIQNLIDDWYPIVDNHNNEGDSRLIIVNDGSSDNTLETVLECAKTRPLLKVLTKPNSGHGATVLFGYRYAIKHNADYIFQTDSDRQTIPDEFEQFWSLRKQYDAIIGNRSARQDGKARKFVEKTLLAILKIIFNVRIPDSNAPFRLMKRELIEQYIKKMPENYNLPNVMLTTYFVYFHEKVKFIEITFKPRQGGVNSINTIKILKMGWNALGDFIHLKKHIDD